MTILYHICRRIVWIYCKRVVTLSNYLTVCRDDNRPHRYVLSGDADRSLGRADNPAAAGNLHPENRHRLYVVRRQYRRQLLGVVDRIELRAAYQDHAPLNEPLMHIRPRERRAVRRDKKIRAVEKSALSPGASFICTGKFVSSDTFPETTRVWLSGREIFLGIEPGTAAETVRLRELGRLRLLCRHHRRLVVRGASRSSKLIAPARTRRETVARDRRRNGRAGASPCRLPFRSRPRGTPSRRVRSRCIFPHLF